MTLLRLVFSQEMQGPIQDNGKEVVCGDDTRLDYTVVDFGGLVEKMVVDVVVDHPVNKGFLQVTRLVVGHDSPKRHRDEFCDPLLHDSLEEVDGEVGTVSIHDFYLNCIGAKLDLFKFEAKLAGRVVAEGLARYLNFQFVTDYLKHTCQ